MTGHRFSNLDTLLLRMDNPAGPVIVTGMLVLGAPVAVAQLEATITTRLLRFDRFRQRIAPSRLPWETPCWVDCAGLDLDYHVQRVALPPPGDQATLRQTVSALAGAPLDMALPPWQMHLIEPYGAGCVLVLRTHHSLADGVALVHVLLSLAGTDGVDPPPGWKQETSPRASNEVPHSQSGTKRRLAGRLMRTGLSTLGQLRRVPELPQLARDAAAVAAGLVLSPSDADTPFRGTPSLPKSLAWSEPVALEEIKTIGRRLGGTVNDVLLATLAGALLRYVELRQDLQDDATLRAIIPVNRRPPGAEAELGNRLTAVFLPLPLDITDPIERLAEIKRRMDGLKDSLQPGLVLTALEVVSRVPSLAFTWAMDFMSSRATAIVTNVKGPQERLYLADAPVEELMAWIPRYGGIGIGISILSYDGQVRLGIISDRKILPDPQNIIAAFQVELDTLLALARERKPPLSMKELSALLDAAIATVDELSAGDRVVKEEPAMPLAASPAELVPLAPDFNRVLTVLRLAGEPDRVPNMELHVDWQIKQAFLGRPIQTVQDDVDFWYRAGYDYVHLRANYEYRMVGDGHREDDRLYAGDMQLSKWEGEERSLVSNWRDFEAYPWPDPECIDFSNLVECSCCLYPGMKIISGVGGIFTRVWRIMGFETFALALADQPELVAALFERVARIQLAVFRRIVTMEGIGAMWYGDDLAYYSGTMVRPEVLRRHVFPVLAEMGALCRQHDLPFIIHSDGNLWGILPDLIACGFNAIHPVEPKAMDSRELKAAVGDKLALLGNIEIGEVLALGTPTEVAADVCAHIRDLAPGGGYAVGSSNTVAHYIPLDNFTAMVQATRQFGRYPIRV